MDGRFCQSCGMPMGSTNELYGTEKNGSKSTDYCSYCYENGDFKFHGSLEEMIDMCVQPMVEDNPGMSEEGAREMMARFLPILKRWKAQ